MSEAIAKSYITTPIDYLQEQTENLVKEVSELNAIRKDYEDLKKKHSELEHRFYELQNKHSAEIKDLTNKCNKLKRKLKRKEESLWVKEEQLENYQIAVGIAFAIVAFFIAIAIVS